MLTSAPPGSAPADVNRQLPQGLAVPGNQRQGFGGGGTPTLFGHYGGVGPGPIDLSSGIGNSMTSGQMNQGLQQGGMSTGNGDIQDPGNLAGIISALVNSSSSNNEGAMPSNPSNMMGGTWFGPNNNAQNI